MSTGAIKKYDTSGNESDHGCFVLYTEHVTAVQAAYGDVWRAQYDLPSERFEAAIREFGVDSALEYFGVNKDSALATELRTALTKVGAA